MLLQLQTIEVPSWLTNLTPNAIMHAPLPLHDLLRESPYYPSSGFDGDPIKHLGGNVLSVRESKFVTFVTVKVLLCGKMVLNSQMVIGSMSNLN